MNFKKIKLDKNYIINFIKKNPFILAFLAIIILAGFLRVYLLYDHFSIDGDAARDIIIATEAITRFELPPIGPFSSAGPFVTGPIYYWFLILASIIFPFGLYDFWIFLVIISITNVVLFIYIGYLLRGYKLALILGILSATSYQLIHFSLNITNPIFIPFLTTLLILFYILLLKKKKSIFAFLVGIVLGVAINFHYQALNLSIFLPFLVLIPNIKFLMRIKLILLFVIGLIVPLLPLLWWDSKQGFSNIYNILDYLLVAQYRIYVPNSWKIFIFDDMGNFWGNAIGGFKITGFMSMLILFIGSLITLINFNEIKKKIEIIFIPLILLILLFVNRYYHGIRQEVYLLYFTPFIIISVGLAFYFIFTNPQIRRKTYIRLIAILFFIMLIFGNFYVYIDANAKQGGNISSYRKDMVNLSKNHPNVKFTLYDWRSKIPYISIPASLFLKEEDLEASSGMKLAIVCIPSNECLYRPKPIGYIQGYPFTDISTFSAQLIKQEFQDMNTANIYDELMGWAKKNELKHTFSLKDYIYERLK